jgi:hypothetical protein
MKEISIRLVKLKEETLSLLQEYFRGEKFFISFIAVRYFHIPKTLSIANGEILIIYFVY